MKRIKSIDIHLTGAERLALRMAIRIGLEDGSLEPWRRAARSASKKIGLPE